MTAADSRTAPSTGGAGAGGQQGRHGEVGRQP